MKENIFKKMRLEAGLSQGDVAKQMGYTTAQFISNHERNLSLPPPNSLRKLAKIYGVDAAVLIDACKEIMLKKYSEKLDKKIGKVS